jgi:hypothetical protein
MSTRLLATALAAALAAIVVGQANAATLQPGSSWDAAYDAAACGAVIELAAGTWPAQTLTGAKCAGNPVVFREVSGARVVVTSLSFDPADNVTVEGVETAFASVGNVVNQRGVWVGPGSDNVKLVNVDAGSVDSWFATNLTVLGGDYGPCFVEDGVQNVCGNNKQDVLTGGLFDGVRFHDLNYGPNGAGAHWECMYLNGVHNFTLRSSYFKGCAIFDVFMTISGPDAGARGHQNVTISNNFFDRAWTENGQTRDSALVAVGHCTSAAQPSVRNMTISGRSRLLLSERAGDREHDAVDGRLRRRQDVLEQHVHAGVQRRERHVRRGGHDKHERSG